MAETKTLVAENTVNALMEKVTKEINGFQDKGDLHFPPNYSVENAVKGAWLIIMQTKDRNDRPALTVCTQTSIYNALLDTVVQGLIPQKKQCYYIVYGNQLLMQRSYFGTAAVTERVAKLKKPPFAQVIYEGDELDYEIDNGVKHNIKHKQKFGNIDPNKIKGAYCTLILPDGSDFSEIMTIDEIHRSWSFGQAKGNSKAHNQTPGEMAKKTVISRACKLLLNTSDDSDLVMGNILDHDQRTSTAEAQEEIDENANKIPLEIDDAADIDMETGELKEPATPTDHPAEKIESKSPTQTTLDAPGF